MPWRQVIVRTDISPACFPFWKYQAMQNVDTEFSLGGRAGPTSFISEEDENGSMKKNLKGTEPD